jgi:membrane-bound lytic murein transglycosylase D
LLPIVESAYYPFSYSHGTASGLWQFIPSTGKLYGLKNNWWYDGRRDVLASTKAAVRYLKNLNKLFKGDWLLTIAAYNSGPGRVQRAVRNNKAQGKPTDFWHLKLPEETKGYVPRLLAVAELIKHPEKYGQTITPVANQQAVQAIKLNTQFDLALIADWAELELKTLHTLNPGLKRWATPNKNTYMLLLPNKNMGLFKQAMRDNPNIERLGWTRHKVKSGDNLSKIARKYRAIVDQIISVNNLQNSLIKVGDYLIVPIARKKSDEYVLSEYQRGKIPPSRDRSKSKVIHNVESGDNLWRIAKRYQVSVENLIKWNLIKRPNMLKLGRKLVIWQTKAKKDFSLVTTLGININRKVSYRVKRGDNLSLIANKFGVNVKQIKQWNKLNDKH